jgi:hypothetical protein
VSLRKIGEGATPQARILLFADRRTGNQLRPIRQRSGRAKMTMPGLSSTALLLIIFSRGRSNYGARLADAKATGARSHLRCSEAARADRLKTRLRATRRAVGSA